MNGVWLKSVIDESAIVAGAGNREEIEFFSTLMGKWPVRWIMCGVLHMERSGKPLSNNEGSRKELKNK